MAVEQTSEMHLARRTALTAAIVLGMLACAVLVWLMADVLLLLFAGLLFAVFLSGVSRVISARLGTGRGWTLACVLLLGLALATGVTWMVAPGIGNELEQLNRTVPKALERLRSYVDRYEWTRELYDGVSSQTQELGSQGDVLRRVTGFFSSTVGAFASLFMVVFFGLFLAADPQLYRRGFLHLIPQRSRSRATEVLDAVDDTLWWWLLAKIASMLVVGVLTWAGLRMMDVPIAFTLALIASILTFIPNLGPVLSAIPAMLLALQQDPMKALWVGVLFLAIQIVESYLITPIFQQRAIALPPAVVIAAQVLMGVLSGGVGLIVATPLAAMAFVLVRELYVRDVLGDLASNSSRLEPAPAVGSRRI